MLNWNEFESKEKTTLVKPASEASQEKEMVSSSEPETGTTTPLVTLNSNKIGSRLDKAKEAIKTFDAQIGEDALAGSASRINVDQKAMINCRADVNQLVPFKYEWAWV